MRLLRYLPLLVLVGCANLPSEAELNAMSAREFINTCAEKLCPNEPVNTFQQEGAWVCQCTRTRTFFRRDPAHRAPS